LDSTTTLKLFFFLKFQQHLSLSLSQDFSATFTPKLPHTLSYFYQGKFDYKIWNWNFKLRSWIVVVGEAKSKQEEWDL